MNRRGNTLVVVIAIVSIFVLAAVAAAVLFLGARPAAGPAGPMVMSGYDLSLLGAIRQPDRTWRVTIQASHADVNPWDEVKMNGAKVVSTTGAGGPWKATLVSMIPTGSAALKRFAMEFEVEAIDDISKTALSLDVSASYRTLLSSGSWGGGSFIPLR